MRVVGLKREKKSFRLRLSIFGSSLVILSGLSVAVFAGPGKGSGGRYAIFDAPNSGYTLPTSINDRGEVTGYVFTSDRRVRGFVRMLDGRIDVFDAVAGGTDTEPVGINNNGEVAGGGFLRLKGGQITLFSAPGALPGRTFASGINSRGSITGKFVNDTPPLDHGYVRSRDGKITTFDPPSSSDLVVAGINDRGDVAGTFEDWTESGKQRIFVRDENGLYAFVDLPNGSPLVAGINNRGEIAGVYVLSSDAGNKVIGYFRDQRGIVTEIDIPDPDVTGVNNHGEVVGIFSNPEKGGKTCGFIWRLNGRTTILDFPEGTATYAYGINNRGQVIGAFDVAGLGSKRRGFVYSEYGGDAGR